RRRSGHHPDHLASRSTKSGRRFRSIVHEIMAERSSPSQRDPRLWIRDRRIRMWPIEGHLLETGRLESFAHLPFPAAQQSAPLRIQETARSKGQTSEYQCLEVWILCNGKVTTPLFHNLVSIDDTRGDQSEGLKERIVREANRLARVRIR